MAAEDRFSSLETRVTLLENSAPTCREDRRAASNLVTTLSGYLITAALAVLGAQAVVATFVLDRRQHLTSFYYVGGFGMGCLVASIIAGGTGIWEIIVEGAKGNWKTGPDKGWFNWQAVLVLAGAILVAISAFLGDPKA